MSSNLEFVLGNKLMVGTVNANREYFAMGARDMAHAEAAYAGCLARRREGYPAVTREVRGANEQR